MNGLAHQYRCLPYGLNAEESIASYICQERSRERFRWAIYGITTTGRKVLVGEALNQISAKGLAKLLREDLPSVSQSD